MSFESAIVACIVTGLIAFCGALLLKVLFKQKEGCPSVDPARCLDRLAECEKAAVRYEEHAKNVDKTLKLSQVTTEGLAATLINVDKSLVRLTAIIEERAKNHASFLLQNKEN